MLPTEANPPLSYERVTKAKIVGCIVYLLMIPVVAVVAVIIGGMIGYGLGALVGSPDGVGMVLGLVFAAIGLIGALWFGIRDFYRRNANRILIHDDRLEIFRTNTPRVIRFEDLLWIEGPSRAFMKADGTLLSANHIVRLKPRQGATVTLQNEEWPVRQIMDGLVERAIPPMTRSLMTRIDAGESVEIRPANLLAVRMLISAAFCLGFGGLLLFFWWKRFRETKQFGIPAVPLFLLVSGVATGYLSGKARGGIVLERLGVRRRKDDPLIPWEEIREVREGSDAIEVDTGDASPIRLGMLARNYEACLAILREKAPKE